VIEAAPNGTGWWSFRVKDAQGYVNATVTVDLLPGQQKVTQRYGANRAIAATFYLGQHQGKTATVTAKELQGTRQGQLQVVA
jgi:AICAR transformylase/IMP cyclohydrolase PurH